MPGNSDTALVFMWLLMNRQAIENVSGSFIGVSCRNRAPDLHVGLGKYLMDHV